MGLKIIGFHRKLKWNTKPRKIKEKPSGEVICLRYTFNQGGFDNGLFDTPSTSKPVQNVKIPPVKLGPKTQKPPAKPKDVKLPPNNSQNVRDESPPAVKPRIPTQIPTRQESEEPEYIVPLEPIQNKTLNDSKKPEGKSTPAPRPPPAALAEAAVNENLQTNSKFEKVRIPNAIQHEEPNRNEDGSWDISFGGKQNHTEKKTVLFKLDGFEDDETKDESDDEEYYVPQQPKTIAGSSLSNQALKIFFESDDEEPQPPPRRINYTGRSSVSSEASEASA